jgi:DNA-binding transcriptional LysR family regulator
MKWRFEDIQTFLDVMDSGSITASAARLNLSKSAVSKRISDLEAALGTSLFQRSPGRIRPTETAASFFDRVHPLVTELGEAAESAAWGLRGLRGRLRITAPMSFGTLHLSGIIADFAHQHPELELTIDYDDRMVDLIRSGFDVGIRVGAPRDSSLVARKLCVDPRVICCSPAYARAKGMPERIEDLARFERIDYAHVQSNQLWHFENPDDPKGAPLSVTLKSRIVANNGEAMRDLAIAGLGIFLAPMFIVAEPLADGRLIALLPALKPPPLVVSAIYPPATPLAPKVRAFVDHLAASIGRQPDWLSAAART